MQIEKPLFEIHLQGRGKSTAEPSQPPGASTVNDSSPHQPSGCRSAVPASGRHDRWLRAGRRERENRASQGTAKGLCERDGGQTAGTPALLRPRRLCPKAKAPSPDELTLHPPPDGAAQLRCAETPACPPPSTALAVRPAGAGVCGPPAVTWGSPGPCPGWAALHRGGARSP